MRARACVCCTECIGGRREDLETAATLDRLLRQASILQVRERGYRSRGIEAALKSGFRQTLRGIPGTGIARSPRASHVEISGLGWLNRGRFLHSNHGLNNRDRLRDQAVRGIRGLEPFAHARQRVSLFVLRRFLINWPGRSPAGHLIASPFAVRQRHTYADQNSSEKGGRVK